jgi:hypothetical protein
MKTLNIIVGCAALATLIISILLAFDGHIDKNVAIISFITMCYAFANAVALDDND